MSCLPQMRGVMIASASCVLLAGFWLGSWLKKTTYRSNSSLLGLTCCSWLQHTTAFKHRWQNDPYKGSSVRAYFRSSVTSDFCFVENIFAALIDLLSFLHLPDKGISQKENISNPRTAELHCWATNYVSMVSHCLTVSKFRKLCHILATHQ